jgi:hypothetical protein
VVGTAGAALLAPARFVAATLLRAWIGAALRTRAASGLLLRAAVFRAAGRPGALLPLADFGVGLLAGIDGS